jgi:uncharacterized protein YdhG (YjbR/CyaY superfamily)
MTGSPMGARTQSAKLLRKETPMPEKKAPRRPTKAASATGKTVEGFTAEERAAMRERARELKAGRADGESAVLEKIAEMPEPDRSMALRLHALIKSNAPELSPRTWYGMPAYANREGKVVCFFTPASKFKTRYATLGFNDVANLDEGNLWPTSFALKGLTAVEEAKIAELVKRAMGRD